MEVRSRVRVIRLLDPTRLARVVKKIRVLNRAPTRSQPLSRCRRFTAATGVKGGGGPSLLAANLIHHPG